MAAVSTIVAAAAVATSAVGMVASGIAAGKQAKFQSAVARQQASRARRQAEIDADDFRRRISRQFAANRAGKDLSASESSLLAAEDFAGEAELNALRIRNQGEVDATRLTQQAALLDARGRSARTGGFVRAGATLLSGFNNIDFGGGSGSLQGPGLDGNPIG